MLRRREGFTLIELLIVVVVIGILAVIAIPKFGETREQAFLATMKSDLRNLVTQQEIFYSDATNYEYTTDKAALAFAESEGVTVTIGEADADGWSATSAHTGLADVTCAIYRGDVDNVPSTTAAGEPEVAGVILCDEL